MVRIPVRPEDMAAGAVSPSPEIPERSTRSIGMDHPSLHCPPTRLCALCVLCVKPFPLMEPEAQASRTGGGALDIRNSAVRWSRFSRIGAAPSLRWPRLGRRPRPTDSYRATGRASSPSEPACTAHVAHEPTSTATTRRCARGAWGAANWLVGGVRVW